MFLDIEIKNFVLIKNSQIHLHPSLTVVTGETGSGKSIFLESIKALLGNRCSSEKIGGFENKSYITAFISFDEPIDKQICLDFNIQHDESPLSIQKSILPGGKSSFRVLGEICSLQQVKNTLKKYIHIHSQHETPELLKPEMHLEILDTWIGEEAITLRKKMGDAYTTYTTLHKEIKELENLDENRLRELDIINFQIEEIQEADIKPGEMEALSQHVTNAEHSVQIQEALSSALDNLQNDNHSISERLIHTIDKIHYLTKFIPNFATIEDRLNSIRIDIDDLIHDISSNNNEEAYSPQELEQNIQRLELLKRVFKKYGGDESSALAFYESILGKKEALDNISSNLEEKKNQLEKAKKHAETVANELHLLREKHIESFSQNLTREIQDLMMPHAKIEVEISPSSLNKNGHDSVTILFSANKGSSLKPIHSIASGGEMSRVVLALKMLLADKGEQKIFIFDEIDTGVSGKAAHLMAEKLKQLSQHAQVIVISHLPQIAAVANSHILVHKNIQEGKSVTEIKNLDTEERVEEIARLLAGKQINEAARLNAKDLIGQNS